MLTGPALPPVAGVAATNPDGRDDLGDGQGVPTSAAEAAARATGCSLLGHLDGFRYFQVYNISGRFTSAQAKTGRQTEHPNRGQQTVGLRADGAMSKVCTFSYSLLKSFSIT